MVSRRSNKERGSVPLLVILVAMGLVVRDLKALRLQPDVVAYAKGEKY
jgi:hypothetical protein